MEQRNIKIGTHGEQYGNWMSNPVFYMLGGVIAVFALLTFLFFKVFHFPILGVIFLIIFIAVAAATCWFAWIRKQYSFGGGGIMDRFTRCCCHNWILMVRGRFLKWDADPAP